MEEGLRWGGLDVRWGLSQEIELFGIQTLGYAERFGSAKVQQADQIFDLICRSSSSD